MSEDNKDKIKAVAIQQLLSSDGWKYLLEEITEELENIDMQAAKDMSTDVGYSCMQRRLGILYIVNRAKDIVDTLA